VDERWKMTEEVFVRYKNNPIFTMKDMPFPANAVFNPGVAEHDGEIVLLLRIEDRQGISQIRVARSKNGVDNWKIDDTVLLEPDLPGFPYEEWGCEDPRVTKIGHEEWVIAYTAYSRYGPAVALAITKDFVKAERLGIVLAPNNKDATVFPDKFGDTWFLLHRPVSGSQEHIWFAVSRHDLEHWSSPGILLVERGGPWWDGMRIGVGAPPIRTDKGWLLIYHGVKGMLQEEVYRLGLAMLDLENPRRVLARSSNCVFAPEAPYEQVGLIPNVVYTCGALKRGDEIWMYYGATDSVIGLAIAKTDDLIDFVFRHDYLDIVGKEKGMEP
jgi:beta-1,4-mannooligosaccharide/beta-1,4-mannosyl-N-acetylglucosamine phosphorylase